MAPATHTECMHSLRTELLQLRNRAERQLRLTKVGTELLFDLHVLARILSLIFLKKDLFVIRSCSNSRVKDSTFDIFVHNSSCPQKRTMPKYNGVSLKNWENIIEIFTTEFSTYMYIVCKNSRKFNVKIVLYCIFSTTRQIPKFPSRHRSSRRERD